MVLFTKSAAVNIRHANSTEAMVPNNHFLLSRNSHLKLGFLIVISISSVLAVFAYSLWWCKEAQWKSALFFLTLIFNSFEVINIVRISTTKLKFYFFLCKCQGIDSLLSFSYTVLALSWWVVCRNSRDFLGGFWLGFICLLCGVFFSYYYF